MLRYDRQTKPGLVALYDIRPGNRAGPFLQPRSPHGAFPRWRVNDAVKANFVAQLEIMDEKLSSLHMNQT